MCEHAGMLNHLYAKIDDLEIGEGQVVAQTAPQCFDISLWQLVSALLAGGRTLLVEQEVILDVERFVDTIARRPGRRAPGRAVLPRSRPVLPGAAPARAAGPAVRVGHRRGAEEGAHAALVRGQARDQAGQRLRADRDLGRHQPRGHGPGAGQRPGPARPARQQRARLRRRRAPVAGAARRPRRDRLLRGLRRPRVRQRPRAHPAGLHGRPAPPGPAALPGRRLRPLAARRQAGVPRPPGQPGQDQRLPDRDRRDREHPAAGARRPRRRRGGRRAGRPDASTWWPSTPPRGRSRPPSCGTGWPRRCPSTWSRRPSTGGKACR